jgi:AraC family transcriptional regulator
MSEAKMQQAATIPFEKQRFENSKAIIVAGLRERLTYQTIREIPALWQRFVPYMDRMPGRVGRIVYGLCWDLGQAGIDYLAAVEVSTADGLPAEFSVVKIPAQKYAVVAHPAHVSRISETCAAIGQWLGESNYSPLPTTPNVPSLLERYGEDFNPKTGMGGMEIWVPVQD